MYTNIEYWYIGNYIVTMVMQLLWYELPTKIMIKYQSTQCESMVSITVYEKYYHYPGINRGCCPKGPGAKNDTIESPGCFNQILTFESRKWSPVATF